MQFSHYSMTNYSDIAQLVEQVAVNHLVAGSSPAVGAINAGVRSYRQGHPVVTRKVAGSSPAAPAILKKDYNTHILGIF